MSDHVRLKRSLLRKSAVTNGTFEGLLTLPKSELCLIRVIMWVLSDPFSENPLSQTQHLNGFSHTKILLVFNTSYHVGLKRSLLRKSPVTNRAFERLFTYQNPSLQVIKLAFILRLKITRNDWLLADMCPQSANHCALF